MGQMDRISLLLAGLVLLAGGSRLGAQPADHPVRASLISDSAAIAPGRPFRVGLLLDMRPGWHTYWQNPGDAGQATTLKLKLPPGFAARPLQFPVPIRFEQTGGIVGYGYEQRVLLMATVIPPHDLPTGQAQSLSAEARWLVCDPGVCIPGKASLELTLPVAEQAKPDHQTMFEDWSRQLPQKPEAAGATIRWTMSGELSSGQAIATAIVTWPAAVTDVDLVPTASPAVEIRDVHVTAQPQQATISLSLTPVPGQALGPASLPAVVAYTTSEGDRRGVLVEIPLTPAGDPAAKQ
jgi:thiol:disulfide interchange protein DsbD